MASQMLEGAQLVTGFGRNLTEPVSRSGEVLVANSAPKFVEPPPEFRQRQGGLLGESEDAVWKGAFRLQTE